MKKKSMSVFIFCTLLFASFPYSYNPPKSGETFRSFFSTQSLTDGRSVTGGAFWESSPVLVLSNPAIASKERRLAFDFSYLPIFSPSGSNHYAQSFSFGSAIPTLRGVFSVGYAGIYSDLDEMPLGNLSEFYGSFSKNIVDNLHIGFALNAGFGSDWSCALQLGFIHELSFTKISDFRWGVSLLNLGKPYITSGKGIYANKKRYFPGLCTPAVGVSGTFLNFTNFASAFSVGAFFPTFLNCIFDLGLGFKFFQNFSLKLNLSCNIREVVSENCGLYPSIVFSAKFKINTGKILAKKDWEESEIVPSLAYSQQGYETSLLGAEMLLYLGMPDKDAPEIIVGGTK